MKQKRFSLLFAVACFIFSHAEAFPKAGIEIPNQVSVYEQVLDLQGVSIRKKLFLDIYVAAIYSQNKISNRHEAVLVPGYKRMQMTFVYSRLSSSKLKAAWVDGVNSNNPQNLRSLHRNNLSKFYSSLSMDMVRGDKLVIDVAKDSTRVYYNDENLLVVNDPDFFDLLLRTWVGDKPPSKDFQYDLFSTIK